MTGLSDSRRRAPQEPVVGRSRRRWLLPAALWGLVALLAIGIGPKTLSAPWADDPLDEPFVNLAMRDRPTLQWTAPGAGTVRLSYDVRISDSDAADVRLVAGVIVDGRVAEPVQDETVRLSDGRTQRRTVEIPVRCGDRVQLGVQATGSRLRPAQIHTWAEPGVDATGGAVCRLI